VEVVASGLTRRSRGIQRRLIQASPRAKDAEARAEAMLKTYGRSIRRTST